jgi:lysophospholipase L1-like esterase
MLPFQTETVTREVARRSATRFQAAALRLCVAISIGVCLLAAGEVSAYLFLRFRAVGTVPAETIVGDQSWSRTFWQERETAGKNLSYHAYVLWRRSPFKGQTVFVDDNGLRKTYHSYCDSDSYLIWMFGNSGLWGYATPDWQTIPSLLGAEYENSSEKACVVNYGEMGRVSTQEVIELMLALKSSSRKPNLVIFYDGVSDSELPLESDQPDIHTDYNEIKNVFEEHRKEDKTPFAYLRKTYTYRMAGELTKFLRLDVPTGKKANPDRAAQAHATLDNYLKNQELARTLSQHYHFDCLFVWQPALLSDRKSFSAQEENIRGHEQRAHTGVEPLLRATYDEFEHVDAPDFLNLADLFRDHRESVFVDPNHLTAAGNQLVAAKIFERSRRRGLSLQAKIGHAAPPS